MTALHQKYRPKTFDEVIGQDHVIHEIRHVLDNSHSQAFLLHGPAGTGKTTIARIIASHFGASGMGINEVDAATHTGVDDMRKVADSTFFMSLDGGGKRCYIVDECHMLSKNAWNSLLKNVEEPPEHVVWVFCTTEINKVPATIKSRCTTAELFEVKPTVICALLSEVASKESMVVGDEVIRKVALMSNGSPRTALVNLAKVSNCSDIDQVDVLLKEAEGEVAAYDLAKEIFGPCNHVAVRDLLKRLKDNNPESVRIIVFSYASSVWLNSSGQTKRHRAERVMGIFEQPCVDQNRIGDVALRCARLLHLIQAK